MRRTIRDTLIALPVGGGVCIGLYWVGGYLSLALVTGLCWTCGLTLTLHIKYRYPEYTQGVAWTDKRWRGLGVGLVTLAALIGVNPMLPISDELRLGLGFLVIGAGLVAYAAGTISVLEQVHGNSNTAVSASSTAYSPDGD